VNNALLPWTIGALYHLLLALKESFQPVASNGKPCYSTDRSSVLPCQAVPLARCPGKKQLTSMSYPYCLISWQNGIVFAFLKKWGQTELPEEKTLAARFFLGCARKFAAAKKGLQSVRRAGDVCLRRISRLRYN